MHRMVLRVAEQSSWSASSSWAVSLCKPVFLWTQWQLWWLIPRHTAASAASWADADWQLTGSVCVPQSMRQFLGISGGAGSWDTQPKYLFSSTEITRRAERKKQGADEQLPTVQTLVLFQATGRSRGVCEEKQFRLLVKLLIGLLVSVQGV